MGDTQRISLDELISPAAARVVVDKDTQRARFDLGGFPRVDGMLRGKPVKEIPRLVEHLCGICPVAHHLAGIAALENLLGVDELPETALKVRSLLHLASLLDNHAVRLARHDPQLAVQLRRFAKLGLKAAGAPQHFPDVAIPGGVRAPADAGLVEELRAAVPAALEAGEALAKVQFETSDKVPAEFDGADLALVDADGRPDLLGTHLRVLRSGERLIEDITTAGWPELVAEQHAGANAPKPYLTALGPAAGKFRVGPVAQLRVGTLPTSKAAEWQHRWLEGDGTALSARAVMMLHAIEAMAALCDEPALVEGVAAVEPPPEHLRGFGIGWVDGPRGLLVHQYRANDDLLVTDAQIMTPTAQNEVWLADMLSTAAASDSDDARAQMERSIREADPCLPCVEVPDGMMDLEVDVEGAD